MSAKIYCFLMALASLLGMPACADQSAEVASREMGEVPVRAIRAAPAAPVAGAAALGRTEGAVVHLPWQDAVAYVSPLVPEEASGAQVDATRFFQPVPIQVVQGAVPVVLGPDPLCIEAVPRNQTPQVPPAQNPFGAMPASTKDGTDFSLAEDLGLGWHRGATAWWIALQPEEDIPAERFRFERMDAKIAALPPTMEVVVNIMLPERRVAPDRWEVAHGREVYARFLKALVLRYGQRVRHWQFENEPDLGPAGADLPGFAQLHVYTAGRIRALQPEARLLFAGFTGLGGETILDQQLLAVAGRLGTGDAQVFDLHTYGAAGGWTRLDGLYARVRSRLDAAGLEHAAIWMTETGTWTGSPSLPGPPGPPNQHAPRGQHAPPHSPGQHASLRAPGQHVPPGMPAMAPLRTLPHQTERDQARELIKRFVHGFSLGIERIFWAWGIKEGHHDRGQLFDMTGLVYDGLGDGDPGNNIPKLGYFAYKRLIRAMLGRQGGVARLELGPGVHAYQFYREGAPVIIAWKE